MRSPAVAVLFALLSSSLATAADGSVTDAVQTMRAQRSDEATALLRRAAGLPDRASAAARTHRRAPATPVTVRVTFEATTTIQGLHVVVGYPKRKGGFTGRGELVACTSTGAGFFVKNDRDDGTLVLIQADAFDLPFPFTIDCVFDLKSGKTVDTADFPITVVEVTHDSAVGDPATLLPTVSLPDQATAPTCASGDLTMTMTGGDLLLGTSGLGWDLPLSRGGSLTTDLRCAGDRCAIDGSGLAGTAVPPMPFVVAGVPFCVTGSFRSGPTGSYRCDFECVDELSLAVHANVFLVGDAASPCPRCVGDPTPRDGHKDGTCVGGATPDAACDVQAGTAGFRLTSNDCLPAGASVAEPDVDLDFTGLTAVFDEHTDCLAPGYPEGACHCPSQVLPNACADGLCSTGGFCENGPLSSICSGAPLTACRPGTDTEDCEDVLPGAGSCIDTPRRCFPHPMITLGHCFPDSSGVTSIFCAPGTRSAAINTTVGLPGPAAIFLNFDLTRTETPPCSPAPLPSCRRLGDHGDSTFLLQHEANDARDELAWRWLGGEATPPADLGDPRTTDRYALCLYAGAVEPALVGSAIADAGGSCDGRPCWRAKTDGGFVYRTQTPNAAGITRVDLVPGESGGARIVVKGHGENLSLPDLPVVAPVLVQLSTSSGACWEATYGESDMRRNDGERLRAVRRGAR